MKERAMLGLSEDAVDRRSARSGGLVAWSLAAIMQGVVAGAALAQPATDGLFDDWAAVPALAADPVGDASGPLDVTALRVQSRGTRLFVQFDVSNVLNLSSGPAADPTLRLVVSRAPQTITIDFRNRTATRFNGSSNSSVTWTALGFASAPTIAASRFELELDAALIGTQVGDTVQLNFTGADSLAASASFTLTEPGVVAVRRAAQRSSCTALRVISFNTFLSGFADSARRARFVRLIDSVNADVYCFQEEYNGTLAQAQSIINEADPLDNGAVWNVVKAGELVIASPHALTAVQLGNAAYQGVVVTKPSGESTLVINNHMKCCGYIGSTEDVQRISQATAAVSAFNAFRAGTLSPALAPFADVPAIVVGDWNHVGSSGPLDRWLASPGPAMSQSVVRHLIGRETWTWADPDGLGFWPGLLDVVAFDAVRTSVVKAFSLDTAELNAGELTALGLLTGDSTASDHRMVVVDLGSGPSADFNEDSSVNTPDLTFFLGKFGQPSPAGSDAARCDFNLDGTVNTPDLVYFLGRFGVVCD
jgi:hypothetical protein